MELALITKAVIKGLSVILSVHSTLGGILLVKYNSSKLHQRPVKV
jgi:hypothetical protein